MTTKSILAAYGLHFSWTGGASKSRNFELVDFSLEIERGKVLAILGPNGSGKTTLLKILSGIISIQRNGCSGQVRYLGQNFFSLTSAQRAQVVTYVNPNWKVEFPLTAEEIVGFGRICHSTGKLTSKDQEIIQSAMERTHCWMWRDRLFESLSFGERQLVLIARAIAQEAKVILFDEMMGGLDLHHQFQIGKLLRELASERRTVLWVSHDVNLAIEWADEILFMNNGRKILDGPIDSVITEKNISLLYPSSEVLIEKDSRSKKARVYLSY